MSVDPAKVLKGGCPVGFGGESSEAKSSPAILASGCPAGQGAAPAEAAPAACASEQINPLNQMKVEERQKPSPGQLLPLQTDRVVSTIPKSDFNPAHQEPDQDRWHYPSHQMFYNAMKRKGWKPVEEDMPVVVAMHNAVNEKSWQQVMAWERLLHGDECAMPRLKRFSGDATAITPKARFRSWLGYTLPFDRHDWIVDRCGKEVHYVLDFYSIEGGPGVGFHIDARPALDSVDNVVDRMRMALHKLKTGFFSGSGK